MQVDKVPGSEKRSVAVVGLGMAAKPHALSLQALHERVRVKAIFCRNAEHRQAFSAEYGFPAVDSIDKILDDQDISAVILLTPPNARQSLVTALCERNKHILMEKPLERTVAGAESIVELCTKSDIKVGVVFQNRYRDGALQLVDCLAQGKLGTVHSAHIVVPWWRDQAYYDEPLRGSYERDGGGVLISQAIHTLDLMLMLMGPVSQVACITGTTLAHSMESEDYVGAGLRFRSGAVGALMATTAQYPGEFETITLCGTHATAVLRAGELNLHYLDGRSEQLGTASSGGGSADPMAFSHVRHQRLIEDFLDALDQDRQPAATLEHALNAQRLIDALVRSSREEQHIDIL